MEQGRGNSAEGQTINVVYTALIIKKPAAGRFFLFIFQGGINCPDLSACQIQHIQQSRGFFNLHRRYVQSGGNVAC